MADVFLGLPTELCRLLWLIKNPGHFRRNCLNVQRFNQIARLPVNDLLHNPSHTRANDRGTLPQRLGHDQAKTFAG